MVKFRWGLSSSIPYRPAGSRSDGFHQVGGKIEVSRASALISHVFMGVTWKRHGRSVGETIRSKSSVEATVDPPGKLSDGIYLVPVP